MPAIKPVIADSHITATLRVTWGTDMDAWQKAALDYIQSWLAFQMRLSQLPGCTVAIAHRDKVVAEFAFGHANLASGEKLTPRHRFRVASHSKSFTSAGLMKLREQRKLRLDDPVGDYVEGLHAQVAQVTLGQMLSHSAGLTRDGVDSGQFTDSRPFLNAAELMAELQLPPAINPGARLKYSNHGYALLGLVIQAVTGEPYRDWIAREIVAALRLPFADASVIDVTGRDRGRFAAAAGYASHGEAVRRVRNKAGKVTEVWLGGARLRPEQQIVAAMERRFGSDKAPNKPRARH
jgi:CubicO group peptidase (beta-lactamase class C family)